MPARNDTGDGTWLRLAERLNTGSVDWKLLLCQLESGATGKIELDIKDGAALGARMVVSLNAKS